MASDLTFNYRPMKFAQDLPPHFFEQPHQEETAFLDSVGEYTFEHRPYSNTRSFTGSRYTLFNTDAPDSRRIMIFGDSFSYDAGLAAVASALFRETIFFWSKDMLWDEVDRHQPDLLLWESAERFLATVPKV